MLMLLGLLGWAFGGQLDRWLHLVLHVSGRAPALRWLLWLTNLGGATVMIPAGIAGCALLILSSRFAPALWLFATVASGRIIVELAKLGFARPRPPSADRLADVTSLSFPSSHAAGTVLTCGALCLVLNAGRRGWFACGLFALAIGISRVMLGVHWPSDVVAGWGFGLAWVMLCARWLPQDRPATVR
jgi:membrane-associated phospholipid phosphatase